MSCFLRNNGLADDLISSYCRRWLLLALVLQCRHNNNNNIPLIQSSHNAQQHRLVLGGRRLRSRPTDLNSEPAWNSCWCLCTHKLVSSYYSFIDLGRMKGWVDLVGWPAADGLPISCRSGAGQRKYVGLGRHFTTEPMPPTWGSSSSLPVYDESILLLSSLVVEEQGKALEGGGVHAWCWVELSKAAGCGQCLVCFDTFGWRTEMTSDL